MPRGRPLGAPAQELLNRSYHTNDGGNVDDIVDRIRAQLCDPNKSFTQICAELRLTGSEWKNHGGKKGKGWNALQNLRRSIENNGVAVLERYIRDYVLNVAPDNPPALAPVVRSSNNVAVVNDAPVAAAAAGNVAARPPVAPIPAPEAYATQAQMLEIITATQASTNQLFDRVGERFGEVGEGLNRVGERINQVGGQVGELTQVMRYQQNQIDGNRERIDENRVRIGNLAEGHRYLEEEQIFLGERQDNMEERHERYAEDNGRRLARLERQVKALTPKKTR